MCTNAPLMTSSAERRAPGATTKPITAPVKTSSRGWVDVRRSGVNATYPDFLSPLLAMGAGLGLITAPATTAIVAATPVEKHGVAAAVNDAICEIGAAIGVAVAGSVLTAGYVYRIQPVLPTVPSPAHQPLSDSLAAALQVAEQPGPCAQHLADIAREAIAHGKSQAALALSPITAVSAVILDTWARGRPSTTARQRLGVETNTRSHIDTFAESTTS
ncbi:major facilitator transporter [Mycobacterium europaeum]|uniref:Major facilitator transporter n=3 Tax=Mycobacterium TaxID=1763 RepID=A0A0U1DLN5_9MYCO|nr:major facilitator transporter [Mycobacterium europaeum]